jgi:hypothetical protein
MRNVRVDYPGHLTGGLSSVSIVHPASSQLSRVSFSSLLQIPGDLLESDKELIALLGKQFVQRKDVKAYQGPSGDWYPVRNGKEGPLLPMSLQDFEEHLAGRKTLGHYMVEPGTNLCKLFAFDIDLTQPKQQPDGSWFRPTYPHPDNPGERVYDWIDSTGAPHDFNPREVWLWPKESHDHPAYKHLTVALRCTAEALAGRINHMLGIPTAILNSGGKGLHVYGFTGTMPAEEAIGQATDVINSFGVFNPTRGKNFYRHVHDYDVIEIEVFPKQSEVSTDGFGNLMRLPLGVNQKTGKKSYFVSCRTGYDRVDLEMDAMRALEGDLPWE